jgi:carbon-monoxide dehydrogenase medium subunit
MMDELARRRAVLCRRRLGARQHPDAGHRQGRDDHRRARRTAHRAGREFFVDLFTTAVGPDEVLVEVRIPKKTGWGAHYEKSNRVVQAWSIVAVAAAVRTEGASIAQAPGGTDQHGCHPGLGDRRQRALVGQQVSAETIRAAAEHAAEGTSPMSDGNADADYREHLARVLAGRAVAAAAGVRGCPGGDRMQ